MDSIERRNDLLHDMVSYKKPTFALSNTGAGLGISIDRFSKHEKSKRRALDFFEAQEREEYINYRYSAQLVAESTGFKDETLRKFIQQSRPSYDWLRDNTTAEDIRYYINDQLKKFSAK
jgi:3-methyladenine DNA glycosylase AlkD